MFKKLLLLCFFASFSSVQATINLMCDFQIRDNVCTCVFLIYNPNGDNSFTIGGNPGTNCTFSNTVQIVSTGITTNIPTIICDTFPMLESLVMEKMGINTLEPNPFYSCTNLKILRIRDNQITYINPHTFSNTKLQTLDLYNNTLQSLNYLSFYNLGNLQTLNLQLNPGVHLPATVFDTLRSLVSLDLRYCEINTVETGWFSNIGNLNTLYLSYNTFQMIPATAFNNLGNLLYLSMSYGTLSTLNANTFAYNRRLQTLDLNHNSLTSISSSLFASFENLSTLSLSANSFYQIPANTFESLTSLRTFSCDSCNIDRIEIQWFSTMRNLISVSLAHNNLIEIPRNAFTSTNLLENVYLSDNNLVKLESRSFGSLANLRTLSVTQNNIDEIEHHFMNQSTVHRTAFFSGNNCTQLNTDNFLGNKAGYMQQMTGCFDNFDRIMIELETYNSTLFDWHNIRPNDDWQALRVRIQAAENAHIGLTDSLDRRDPLVEIHIGERDNRDSSIYERGERVLLDNEHRRLNENEMRTFIIGWKFGIVMVYEEAERFPFMAHFIREPFPVNFFGLRTNINTYNSRNKAIWNVSRIQGNELLPVIPPTTTTEQPTTASEPITTKTDESTTTTEQTTTTTTTTTDQSASITDESSTIAT
ncbi:hypothetical protein ACKWTF_016190 [Chironomus riparius]